MIGRGMLVAGGSELPLGELARDDLAVFRVGHVVQLRLRECGVVLGLATASRSEVSARDDLQSGGHVPVLEPFGTLAHQVERTLRVV